MVLSKWNADLTLKFILLYKEQECLWRVDSVTYRDRSARTAALRKILEGMKLPGLTMDDVKKKIKYLRSTYMVEVNKIEKSIQNDGSGTTYKPCLSWFNLMNSFIKSVKVEKDSFFDEQNVTMSGDEDCNSNGLISTIDLESPQGQPPEFHYVKGYPEEETVNRKRRHSNGKQASQIHFNKVNTMEIRDFDSEDNSEFEIFGKCIGIQLKSLDEEDAIMAQQEIQSILTRYKLKKMRRKTEGIHIVHTPTHPSQIRQTNCQPLEDPTEDESVSAQYLDKNQYDIVNNVKVDVPNGLHYSLGTSVKQ